MPLIDEKKPVPLYLQCADVLSRRIRGGTYAVGEFIPSERDLSRTFGVARLTIRRGLAELLRAGALESVPGAGTRVLRAEKKAAPARRICCVSIRNLHPRSLSPYYADIFSGIEQEAAESGYQLTFAAFERRELWGRGARAASSALLRRGDSDGALFIGGMSDEFVMPFVKSGMPLVLADKPMPGHKVASVVPDNLPGAFEATRYLIGLGHRRIAFLAAPDDAVVRARLDGLLKAHGEAGLRFDPRLRIQGDYEVKPAHEAVGRFLSAFRKRNWPTAIFAVNDEAAIGAMKAVQEAGLRIPQDVSIVGFDDIAWAEHTRPPLSTVRVEREEMGRLAARMLIRQIEAGPSAGAPTRLTLQTALVVRESCGRPRCRR